MRAAQDACSHDLHGRQVGVSSILMAALYERILSIDHPQFREFPKRVGESFWGTLTPIVEKEYQAKLPKMAKAIGILSQPGNWEALRTTITPHLLPARKLKGCLQQARAAHRYSDLRYNKAPIDKDFFVAVVNHANQMRNRFTILDIAVLLGVVPDETEDLINTWLG